MKRLLILFSALLLFTLALPCATPPAAAHGYPIPCFLATFADTAPSALAVAPSPSKGEGRGEGALSAFFPSGWGDLFSLVPSAHAADETPTATDSASTASEPIYLSGNFWLLALGVLLALSELLSLIPSVRSNGVFQLAVNILRKLSGKPATP